MATAITQSCQHDRDWVLLSDMFDLKFLAPAMRQKEKIPDLLKLGILKIVVFKNRSGSNPHCIVVDPLIVWSQALIRN